MERLAVLDGTKNGENGIPPIGSTRKGLLESQFTKTDWTTLIKVKTRQIEALSELQKHGLMSEKRAAEYEAYFGSRKPRRSAMGVWGKT